MSETESRVIVLPKGCELELEPQPPLMVRGGSEIEIFAECKKGCLTEDGMGFQGSGKTEELAMAAAASETYRIIDKVCMVRNPQKPKHS